MPHLHGLSTLTVDNYCIGLCSLEFLKITLLWEEEEGRGSVRAAGSTGISNFQSNSGWEGEDEVFCPVVSMALLSLSI